MTSMITSEAVNRAMDYILEHLKEDLSLGQVADHCHFSKYYFSRLFKAQTGESVWEFVQRVRLEQSAFRLTTEKERPITDIGADYGYSPSSYSSAFRLHYQTTPISFRRKSCTPSMEHPFFRHETWRLESFEACRKKIQIRNVPDFQVIYERRLGSYGGLSRQWLLFTEKYRDYLTEKTVFLERTCDDPAVTEAKNCLYDLCMSVGKDCGLENITCLPGGKCVVYPFEGYAKEIYGAYQTLFQVYFPRTSYVLDMARSVFAIYHMVDRESLYMELDICLPVM